MTIMAFQILFVTFICNHQHLTSLDILLRNIMKEKICKCVSPNHTYVWNFQKLSCGFKCWMQFLYLSQGMIYYRESVVLCEFHNHHLFLHYFCCFKAGLSSLNSSPVLESPVVEGRGWIMNLHLGPTRANLAASLGALEPGLSTEDHNSWIKEVMSEKAHRKCSPNIGAMMIKTQPCLSFLRVPPGPRYRLRLRQKICNSLCICFELFLCPSLI